MNFKTDRCGIVGLGLIGSAWAEHLRADNVLSAAWNRTPKEEFKEFHKNLKELPEHCDLIHTVVSDEKAAYAVIKTFAPQLKSQHVVVQSTTIDPKSSEELRKLVAEKGAAYLEAPFTGSLPGAKNRATVFYLGGESSLISELTPYLSRLSQRWIHIGDHQQACTLKLSMNLQIASAVQALVESLEICRSRGIQDELFFESLRWNAVWSKLHELKEPKLREDDFSPQFSVKHMAKDMRLLMASESDRSLPFLLAVRNQLEKAESAGLSEVDFAALIGVLK